MYRQCGPALAVPFAGGGARHSAAYWEQRGENEGRGLALETDFHISDETCQLLICGLDRNWGRWMTGHTGEP